MRCTSSVSVLPISFKVRCNNIIHAIAT
jgi:hypothetical protein